MGLKFTISLQSPLAGFKNGTAKVRHHNIILRVLILLLRHYQLPIELLLFNQLSSLFQLIMFLKGFNEEERQKLGKIVGVCLSNCLGNPSCLCALFDDHLVKEGKTLLYWPSSLSGICVYYYV